MNNEEMLIEQIREIKEQLEVIRRKICPTFEETRENDERLLAEAYGPREIR